MAKRAPSRALFDEKERKSSSSSSLLSGLIDEQKEEENERDFFFLLSFFLFSTPTPPSHSAYSLTSPLFSSLIEIINRRNSAFTHEKEEKNKKRQERKKGSKKRKQKKNSLPSSLFPPLSLPSLSLQFFFYCEFGLFFLPMPTTTLTKRRLYLMRFMARPWGWWEEGGKRWKERRKGERSAAVSSKRSRTSERKRKRSRSLPLSLSPWGASSCPAWRPSGSGRGPCRHERASRGLCLLWSVGVERGG